VDRHTPLTSALLEPVLLMLLIEQPRHGYTLLTNLEELGIRTIHPSVVYRILRGMEELEWIESDWDADQTQGPPRRNYRLTGLGQDVLSKWREELKRSHELIAKLLDRIEPQERN
jgi:PadR family transcriptional regulator PadR